MLRNMLRLLLRPNSETASVICVGLSAYMTPQDCRDMAEFFIVMEAWHNTKAKAKEDVQA